jgi:glycerophosphoryl diester phosphodiesterase
MSAPHPTVEIIAHRGASSDAPENTLAAFRLGWKQDADACELDIRLTKDRKIIAIHDNTTRRTARVAGRVSARTLDELRMLDVGSWKGRQWKGERIPTLEEVLETVPDGRRLFIEIKCGPEVLPELARVLAASGGAGRRSVIIAIDYKTILRAREHFPKSEVYWVTSPRKWSRGTRPSVDALIERAEAANVDGLDVGARFAIDREFVSRVKAAGLKFCVWTVDDARAAQNLAALGVDGITTNCPRRLRAHIGSGIPGGKASHRDR